MLQSRYFVSQSGHQLGPFTTAEITSKIFAQEINLSDYLYDEIAGDWLMILTFEEFADVIHFAKPAKAPGVEAQKVVADQTEWFILKGQNRFGPYALFDVIKLLQSRSLFEYDYAWNAKLDTWQLIADLPEFHADKIKELKSSSHPELTEVFFRRRHARASYGASLIIHNNSQVWKGKSFEISPGGAGIELETGHLQVGQTLNIHFKPGSDVPPFNAKCEIVSQRTHGSGITKKVTYGVKFVEVSPQTQEEITNFTQKNTPAA